MNSDFIDLSLLKNQNDLAVKIANFFDKDEISCINLSNLEKAENRDIEEIQYLYYNKKFEGGKELKIIDTLIIDTFPAARYITIRLSYKEQEQIDYKCRYCKNILIQLNIVFAKAYNYLYWKSDDDNKILKPHILSNYSNKLAKSLSATTLEEAKFVINCLITDGSIKNNNNFSYDFSISGIDFHVESNSLGVVKFGFREAKAIYFNTINFAKTDTGISYIIYVLEEAEKNKK